VWVSPGLRPPQSRIERACSGAIGAKLFIVD